MGSVHKVQLLNKTVDDGASVKSGSNAKRLCISCYREPYRDEGDGSTRLLVPEEHNRESSFERRLAVPPRAAATASLDREERKEGGTQMVVEQFALPDL